ncbi:MAG: hypothetical protein GY812_09535 [Actinomycetia bacterium]|nr:hypothetical protein [Actinomycetes bacterium]
MSRGDDTDRQEPIRVIQWYTGDIACHQIRTISQCPWLELVGAVVHHEEKAGLDAGEIAGIDPIGVVATTDGAEALALDADVVLYNPPMERYDEVITMLDAGKDVISIMAGWHPDKRSSHPELVRACHDGKASLYGTGLNPGFSYELALLASSICSEIDSVHIRTCEPQDTLSAVFLEMFGFGRTEDELSEGPSGVYSVFARTLHEITDLLCEELGLAHDDTSFTYEFEPATKDYDGKIEVRKGTMAGLLLTASTTDRGRPVASMEIRFLLGTDYVRDSWLADGPRHGWIDVDVRGVPGSRITHELYDSPGFTGAWATGTKALNAIPSVVAAQPGILSPTDLPMPKMLAL